MALVELRPGDTLNIIWSSIQSTPLGEQKIESAFAFSYEELLIKLKNKSKKGKSRRSTTNGARFSRVVSLSCSALKKGYWSSGVEIDRVDIFDKLILKFRQLDLGEYKNITANARESLKELFSDECISAVQKEELGGVLALLG